MSVYFLSDLHLGHKNVHKFRTQFSTAEAHDEFILEQIKKTLTKRDKVFLLGDNCFTKEKFDALIDAIPAGCIVVYILGNHDLERDLTVEYISSKVHSVHALLKYKHYWISHAPIHPIELRGKVNIHGHTHFEIMGERYINVCPEHTGFKPVALETLPLIHEEQRIFKEVRCKN